MTRAQARYQDYPFVRYQAFDVEQDGPSQNLKPHSFHVILAANVLHATKDVHASLRHLSELLAPGGSLVLVEATQAQRWVDLTFGLTKGWWRFADRDLRDAHPLLQTDGTSGRCSSRRNSTRSCIPFLLAIGSSYPREASWPRLLPTTSRDWATKSSISRNRPSCSISRQRQPMDRVRQTHRS